MDDSSVVVPAKYQALFEKIEDLQHQVPWIAFRWFFVFSLGQKLYTAVVGCRWLLVVGCWLLVVGCCWLLLVTVGYCWLLLVVGC